MIDDSIERDLALVLGKLGHDLGAAVVVRCYTDRELSLKRERSFLVSSEPFSSTHLRRICIALEDGSPSEARMGSIVDADLRLLYEASEAILEVCEEVQYEVMSLRGSAIPQCPLSAAHVLGLVAQPSNLYPLWWCKADKNSWRIGELAL